MTDTSGPIYEVTFDVDREIVDQFDAWLAQHVANMLRLPGVYQAEVFEEEDDQTDRTMRVLQCFFTGYADLERYVKEQAAADREAAVDRFAAGFGIKSRVLRQSAIAGGDSKPAEACLNCGATLGGQYCGNCGQRAASRLISIWELLKEAFGDLLELDSRLWRTLIPLMIRPGQLTHDYLRGRRTRYMPPFRMYLVLSIMFFLIAFFDPRQELGILFEPEPATESEQGADIVDEVADVPIVTDQDSEDADTSGPGITITTDGERDPECDFSDFDTTDMPGWLASRLTRERLQVICDRIVADDGRAFVEKLLDNVPAALFVLLPLMALVLKLLYPLSKRFYVEHLLFVVHYHAFVFLILCLQVLGTRLGSLLRVPELPIDVLSFAMSMYVPIYLYKAQRRVYKQGRFFTVAKFSILTLAYFAGLIVILALVAIFAAFSI
jgi:hypothetical protein